MSSILNENNRSNYTEKPSLIPIYVGNRIVTTIFFEENLNVGGPSYLNENCNMGLVRIDNGQFEGKLVLMYENEFYPSENRGGFITEKEAYELCLNRGKNNIIKKYDIQPEY